MRTPREFHARSAAERAALVRDTWCDACSKADLGIDEPHEYEEHGRVLLAGTCKRCGTAVVTVLIESGASEANATIKQFAVVKVVEAPAPDTAMALHATSNRVPVVGEVGAVLEVLTAQGLPDAFLVECTDSKGATLWLHEFRAHELQVIHE